MPHTSAVIDEDPTLDALLGAQGSLAMREMLPSFPQPIGLLWAKRDAQGRTVDFEFGYGNPRMVTLLERRVHEPPDPGVLRLLRQSTERARSLVDAVLGYASAGELRREPVQLDRLMGEVAEDLRPRHEGHTDWVITVADRGSGVRPEDRDRIFAMFARADRERSGSGIGLAVCRRVVEAHGGRIWVEPADGGGSAFRFTQPRQESSAA